MRQMTWPYGRLEIACIRLFLHVVTLTLHDMRCWQTSLDAMGAPMKHRSPLLSWFFVNDETTEVVHSTQQRCRTNMAENTWSAGYIQSASYALPYLQRVGIQACGDVMLVFLESVWCCRVFRGYSLDRQTSVMLSYTRTPRVTASLLLWAPERTDCTKDQITHGNITIDTRKVNCIVRYDWPWLRKDHK